MVLLAYTLARAAVDVCVIDVMLCGAPYSLSRSIVLMGSAPFGICSTLATASASALRSSTVGGFREARYAQML